jgi:DNA-binding PucR family transcriptional regulator
MPPAARQQPPDAHSTLDRIIGQTRSHLHPTTGSLLAGMHNGDIVVLFPTTGPAELDSVRHGCQALAAALPETDVSIGISAWHQGRASIATAFAEAIDAVKIADSTAIRGRAVGIDEVLIDSMLHASPTAQRILKQTLRPLIDYDATRKGALIDTLRAYLRTRLNITKSAATLYVHPNTVVYRLRKIKEVCGRDPDDPDDLLILSLALKHADLGLVG